MLPMPTLSPLHHRAPPGTVCATPMVAAPTASQPIAYIAPAISARATSMPPTYIASMYSHYLCCPPNRPAPPAFVPNPFAASTIVHVGCLHLCRCPCSVAAASTALYKLPLTIVEGHTGVARRLNAPEANSSKRAIQSSLHVSLGLSRF